MFYLVNSVKFIHIFICFYFFCFRRLFIFLFFQFIRVFISVFWYYHQELLVSFLVFLCLFFIIISLVFFYPIFDRNLNKEMKNLNSNHDINQINSHCNMKYANNTRTDRIFSSTNNNCNSSNCKDKISILTRIYNPTHHMEFSILYYFYFLQITLTLSLEQSCTHQSEFSQLCLYDS